MKKKKKIMGAGAYGGWLCLLFCVLFLCNWGMSALGAYGVTVAMETQKEEKPTALTAGPTVVIDAGHGGEDGGASGVNGVLEKDLNLTIAMMMKEMLEEKGYTVLLTRTEDKLLYTEAQNIYGQRKVYDLKNRLDMACAAESPLLISIHMNTFSQAKYSGLQVYYSQNHEGSRQLAALIQSGVRRDLQPYNNRQIKAAGSSIYLLNRAPMPAVLVECGFLSNPDECQKLSEKEYQRQLSFSMVCAMIEYIEKTKVQENAP